MAAAPPPTLELILRGKDALLLQRFDAAFPVPYPATPATPAPVDVSLKGAYDASSGISLPSTCGRFIAATDKEGVDILDVSVPTSPRARCRIAQPGVVCASFSPLGDMLLTWHRKRTDEPNLLLWSTTDASCLVRLHEKAYQPETWPPLRWTNDQKLCARAGTNEVQLFDGAFAPASGNGGGTAAAGGGGSSAASRPEGFLPVPLMKLPAVGVTCVFPSPAAAPGYGFISFAPANKSRPGAALLWALPNLATPVISRSMQADGVNVKWSPDGSRALMELSLSASDDSYYGDSRLFLGSRDGKINVAILPSKEGSTHDFAWAPTSEVFIVIAGKSPPAATLYNKSGVATFSFGTAPHNTIRFSPDGRVVLLAGFGNMGGMMTFWDVANKTPIGLPANAQCVVNAQWAPDSRHLLTATLRPRLQVDNGFAVWDIHGRCVAKRDIEHLYDAQWRPQADARKIFPPRAPSPMPRVAGGAATATGNAGGIGSVTSGGGGAKYVPPSLRGSTNELRVVAAAMAERYTGAGKITPGASSGGGGGMSTGGVVGMVTGSASAAAPSASSVRRAKAKAKEKEKAAVAALVSGELSSTTEEVALVGDESTVGAPVVDEEKATPGDSCGGGHRWDVGGMLTGDEKSRAARKHAKTLKDILRLKGILEGGGTLDEAQRNKVAGEADVRKRLADLGGEEEGGA